MTTLSTPLNSGAFADAASLALVLSGVVAFGFGSNDLARRLPAYRRLNGDALTTSTGALLTLLGLVMLLMVAGVRSIPIGQACFLGIAAWGLCRGLQRSPQIVRWLRVAPSSERRARLTLAFAMGSTLTFWAYVLRLHVALPNHHDGIVHGALYLGILGAGVPTLGRVPIGFAEIFGEQSFGFYPTGMHSLFAMAGGFWGQWGVISHAGVLKAFFTLALAALPWGLYWILRRLAPNMPWWVGVAVACLANPGFRFPLEAAHEGGASRVVAHLLLAPLYANAILGRYDALRARVVAGITLALAFLIHPSGFITFAALLAFSTLFSAATTRGLRQRLLLVAGLALAALLGGLLVAGILRWNFAVAVPRDTAKPFSWLGLLLRWQGGFSTLFSAEYGMATYLPALALPGLALLFLGRRWLGLSWRAVTYPFWMLLVFLTTLAAQMSSHPLARLLGGTFYDETPRIVELLFETVGLGLAVALWGAWLWLGAASARSATRWRHLGHAFATGTLLAAFAHQIWRLAPVVEHIAFWDREFDTPLIPNLQSLGVWVEENTESDALIVHEPFDSEIWEVWTGRRGSFMFGECHTERRRAPCREREAMIARQLATLEERLARPTPHERCLEPLEAFKRPVYVLMQSPAALERRLPHERPRPRLCRDALRVQVRSQHLIVRYRPE